MAKVPKTTRDYFIDPLTKRATFRKNNLAAFKHGGRSRKISNEMQKVLGANDLGYEIGVLRKQIINIELYTEGYIKELESQGKHEEAAYVELSTQKIVTTAANSIAKILKSSGKLDNDEGVYQKRIFVLTELEEKKISALTAAHMFEKFELGELPYYVKALIDAEVRADDNSHEAEAVSRAELERRLKAYWQNTENEQEQLELRKNEIDAIKQKVRGYQD